MSDAEESRPLQIYADAYGGPDLETTSRARARVSDYVRERKTRRQRWVHRTQGGAVAVLLLAAAYGAWSALATTPSPPQRDSGPIVVTEQAAQHLDLSGGGKLEVRPDSRVRVVEGDHGSVVELLGGEMVVDLPPGATPWRLLSGDHEIEANDASFSVRARDGAPRVTVSRGGVTLLGPDLPDEGVRISAM